MKYSIRTGLVSILGLFILITTAGATQVLYQSLEELGQNSTTVVQGTVSGVRSYWNENHTKIFTETMISVEDSFKGQPGGTVRVVQLGGTVANIRVTAHGALQWRPGEEIVLFLEATAPDIYQVAGFSQGKFQVERDPGTGAAFVSRPALAGVELVGTPVDKTDGVEIQRMPLSTFVRKAMGEGPTIRKN